MCLPVGTTQEFPFLSNHILIFIQQFIQLLLLLGLQCWNWLLGFQEIVYFFIQVLNQSPVLGFLHALLTDILLSFKNIVTPTFGIWSLSSLFQSFSKHYQCCCFL